MHRRELRANNGVPRKATLRSASREAVAIRLTSDIDVEDTRPPPAQRHRDGPAQYVEINPLRNVNEGSERTGGLGHHGVGISRDDDHRYGRRSGAQPLEDLEPRHIRKV